MNACVALQDCTVLESQYQCVHNGGLCIWSGGECLFDPTSDGLCTESGQIRLCDPGYWCNNTSGSCRQHQCNPDCVCPAGSGDDCTIDEPPQCEPDEYDAGGWCESCGKYEYGAGDYCQTCSVTTICNDSEWSTIDWGEWSVEPGCTPWIMDSSFDREQILTKAPCSADGALGRYYGRSRCASGYYGDGRYCNQCPGIMGVVVHSPYGKVWDFTAYNNMSEADDGEWDWSVSWGSDTEITDCYIPAGTVAQDISGTFVFTQDCNYSN